MQRSDDEYVPGVRVSGGGGPSAAKARAVERARRFVARARGRQDVQRLVADGLRLGRGVFIAQGVYLDPGFPWLIAIGDDVTLGPDAMVLVHDAVPKRRIGYSMVAPVTIGDRAFVGARAILLPGVTIGADAVVGAGSVVRSDVPAGAVAIGNPATVVSATDRLTERHRRRLTERPRYPVAGFSVPGGSTDANRRRMLEELAEGPGYVE